jgi:hypothetical protein
LKFLERSLFPWLHKKKQKCSDISLLGCYSGTTPYEFHTTLCHCCNLLHSSSDLFYDLFLVAIYMESTLKTMIIEILSAQFYSSISSQSYTTKLPSSLINDDIHWTKFLLSAYYRLITCFLSLSSLAVEYHLLWTIISYVAWYPSPADDIQIKQTILIWRGWYLSRADNIQLKQMILIWRGRYSFKRDEYHLWWLILKITINHWRWYSTTGDHNQPLGLMINHWGW